MNLPFIGALGALTVLAGSAVQHTSEPPVELGRVAWHRNLDAGLEHAGKVDKPVLLLFQEVPG